MFWKNHDSTTSHKPQYMSAIFYHDDEQKQLAEQTCDEHQKTLRRPIVTKILPAKRFYDAEEYVLYKIFMLIYFNLNFLLCSLYWSHPIYYCYVLCVHSIFADKLVDFMSDF